MSSNYLEFIPLISENVLWHSDDKNIVTLEIENKGFYNRVAQKIFRKPKISYIHLDELGSYVWILIDGKHDILEIGNFVKSHFGEKAEPVYDRIIKYLEILKSYGFIIYRTEEISHE